MKIAKTQINDSIELRFKGNQIVCESIDFQYLKRTILKRQ